MSSSILQSLIHWDQPVVSAFIYLLTTSLLCSIKYQTSWILILFLSTSTFLVFYFRIVLRSLPEDQDYYDFQDNFLPVSVEIANLYSFAFPLFKSCIFFVVNVFLFRNFIVSLFCFTTVFLLLLISLWISLTSFLIFFISLFMFLPVMGSIVSYVFSTFSLVFDLVTGILFNSIGSNKNFQINSELLTIPNQSNLNKDCLHFFHRGNCLFDKRRYLLALHAYDTALAFDSKFSYVHNNKGLVLDKLGRHSEALESYTLATALDSSCVSAYVNRGTSLLEFNRLEEALESFDKAIELDPSYAVAYTGRANTKTRLNKLVEALKDFNCALKLNPKCSYTLKNMKSLEREVVLRDDVSKSLNFSPKISSPRW
ncbi:hypothetical protein RCL1_006723 [Eukaryota sp. TZLM3-RCL]